MSFQHWSAIARADEAYLPGAGTPSAPGGEIVALTEPGRFLGDILDTDGVETVVVCESVDDDTVVALDVSRASIESACAEAVRQGQTRLNLDVAEISGLCGYTACWDLALGAPTPSASQGMSWFILEIDVQPLAAGTRPLLAERIGDRWLIDSVWRATVRPMVSASLVDDEPAAESSIAAWLVTLRAGGPGVKR